MEENRKKYLKIVSVVLASFFLLVLVFYSGFFLGTKKPKEVKISGIEDIDGKSGINLSTFWEVWNLVKERHIDGKDLENKDLIYGAMSGLVSSLKDPYSIFLVPEDSEKFQEDVRGSFGGVGMEIEMKDGNLTIVSPLKGTPASRAGLEAGDIITKVDQEKINGIDINTAVKRIRGEVGTSVVLTVFRADWKEERDISVVREIIKVPTLEWKMKGDIAYVKLMSFNENSLSLFYEAMLKSLFSGSRGLVLDLRNNPGGYLQVATRLAGWFVENGELVVSEQFRDGSKQDFFASGNEALKNFPTVIIVNKGSASASEILAGSLRDIRGVKLVGETTFGKGTVQELNTLTDGSMVKLTIARWVLPSGKILKNEGLEPDFKIGITDEEKELELDPQLEKSLELVRDLLK